MVQFETTFPDCPAGCVHLADSGCQHSEVCKVEYDPTQDVRVGTPTCYESKGQEAKQNNMLFWILGECEFYCMTCDDCHSCPLWGRLCRSDGVTDNPCDWNLGGEALPGIHTIIEAAKLQEDYKALFNEKRLTKKVICDLGIPFRDKYGLTDLQTLQIMRSELTLSELLKVLRCTV